MPPIHALLASLPALAGPSFLAAPSQDDASSAAAPSPVSPAALVAHAADRNRDASVERGEWDAFVERLAPSTDAAIASDALSAALLAPVWDRDGDGRFEAGDLEAARSALDTNGDGTLANADVDRSLATNDALLLLVLVRAGDADDDERLAASELATLSAQADAGELADWIAVAKHDPADQTGLMSAGVLLLGIAPALDADGNGSVSSADFAQLFTRLDADRNGTLEMSEWRARPSGNPNRDRWVVPSRDDREKPCLIPWQRNLDDALALSKRTGKPLLLCINMDDEPASESLAWVHYRDPEFAALAHGFVPLLASPDRHNRRDWNDRGERIVDRRFGRLVDSEHIDIEPTLFERYLELPRVAPRHVGVSPDGEILFDRYLLQSIEPVIEELRRHGNFDVPLEPELDGEAARLASPAAAHRAALETSFVEGDVETRARLASVALSDVRATQHPELLRLALHDPDPRVRTAGVWTFARHAERAPIELAGAALAACTDDPAARAALLAGLERRDDPTAAKLATVHRALERSSALVDEAAWHAALAWAPHGGSVSTGPELYDRLLELEALAAERPDDVETRIGFCALALEQAELDRAAGRDPSILLETARSSAEGLADRDPRAAALAGWACHRQGEFDTARELLERAVPRLLPWAGTPLAARALELLADGNTRAIYAALGAEEPWDPALYTDVDTAYAVLLEHPYGTVEHAAKRFDVAFALGARGLKPAAIASLERFPSDPRMHSWLRAEVLRDEGGAALAAAYDELEIEDPDEAELTWYRGLAELIAAERAVSNGAGADALTAYTDSIAFFEAAVRAQPDFEGSALHYVALDKAGIAHVLFEDGQLEEAAANAIEALTVSPDSAEYQDGLGRTPLEIARRVQRAAKRAGRAELADRIGRAMPSLLDANG